MNVLMISDNSDLAAFVLEEFRQPPVAENAKCELLYSAINRSPDSLRQLGGSATDLTADEEVTRLIGQYDLIISAHCKKIFPKRLVDSVRCINVHPGLNPHNRGWFPQVFSIVNGLPVGVTIHEMVEDIDAGPIIVQEQVPVLPSDTSKDVYDRIIATEKRLLRSWLPKLVSGDYVAALPPSEGNYNSIADYRQLCRLDLQQRGTLAEHIDLLRALTHEPYQNGWFEDEDGHKVYVGLTLKRAP